MKNLKIIYGALLASLVLFGGFLATLANSNGSFPKDVSGIVLGITVFFLPVAWYIPLFFAKKKMILEKLTLKEKFDSYSQSKILAVIFLDAGYTINGVFYFVTADPIHWIGMGIFFTAMLILYPKEKEFAAMYSGEPGLR